MKYRSFHNYFMILLALSMTAAGCKNAGRGNSLMALLGLMDSGGPKVISAQPANNATWVSRSMDVSARFNTDMDHSTITDMTFTLEGPSGPVAGAVTYSEDRKTGTGSCRSQSESLAALRAGHQPGFPAH